MKKLYRSTRDSKLFGLCGGIAEAYNIDATLLRILLIVVTIFSSGIVIFIYLLAGLVVPKEPPYYNGGFGNGFGNGYGNGYGNGGPGSQGNGHGYGSGGAGGNQNFGSQFQGSFTKGPQQQWNGPNAPTAPSPSSSQFDSMFEDLEKKALRKEIDELRAKLAKHEKGEL